MTQRQEGRVIVGGDFNHGLDPDDQGLDAGPVGYLARYSKLQSTFVPNRDTWIVVPHPKGWWPPDGPHHIDHILTSGFRSERFERLISAGSYSDHPAIRSELEAIAVPPPPPPDPPVTGPIPPACKPIADEIEALSASVRQLQDELRQASPGEKPRLLEAIRETQETRATRQAELERCRREHPTSLPDPTKP